jgi:choline dehydrogenase-like flavoprotein
MLVSTRNRDAISITRAQSPKIANLSIAGPEIFPTSGAPNPTYTILALSLRGAESLAENWER